MDAKICGINDLKTLNFILKHKYPPKYIGFICNYPKSKRFITLSKLKKLTSTKRRKKIYFVSVLVNPSTVTLEKMTRLKFDYLQLYDVSSKRTEQIKNKFDIKIITALTIKKLNDVKKYKDYINISEIILFDSKGYEKSLGFNHKLLDIVPDNIKRMLAGNIQYDDKLDKYKKITDIIDISGSLETKGKKDISKINYFLEGINKIKK